MTGAEAGFLLLTSQLGVPDRRTLTTSQLRILSGRVRNAEKQNEDRDLTERDLLSLGYGREAAAQILALLEEGELLEYYCRRGEKAGCRPLTRVSAGYPRCLRQKLGEETPGCLWYKGDISLLSQPMVALVGSRDLLEPNRRFARAVGRQAARRAMCWCPATPGGLTKRRKTPACRPGGE